MGHLPSNLLWYQTQYLFSLLWTPFTLCLGIERLPTRLNLSWYLLTLLSIFSIRELLSATFPDVIYQIDNLVEVRSPGMPTLYSFASMVEFLKNDADFIMMT